MCGNRQTRATLEFNHLLYGTAALCKPMSNPSTEYIGNAIFHTLPLCLSLFPEAQVSSLCQFAARATGDFDFIPILSFPFDLLPSCQFILLGF